MLTKNKYFISNKLKHTKKNSVNIKSPTLLDEIHIGKQLGKGAYGTTYLATDNKNNKYAYKIERILPKEIPKSFKSIYWRENDFAINLANKYPDQFMTLYDSKIDSSCTHQQDYSDMSFKINNLPKERQNYFKKLNTSPYYNIKLWSLIDGTMEDLVLYKLKVSRNIFYDLLLQIVYIVYLINTAGYLHNDFHMGNISYLKTDKKTISILGHNIPTHGYFIKAIDYGLVLHNKYQMTKNEHIDYENNNDLLTVFNMFSIEWRKTENISNKEWDWEHQWMKPIKISKTEKEVLEHYLPTNNANGNQLSKGVYDFLINKLFKLLEWQKWQQRVIGDDNIKCIEPHYLIPLENLLFLVKNIYNPKKVIEYLIKMRI